MQLLLRRLPAAVVAGLLLDAAFPPHDLWLLAPVGVAVLTLACRGLGARAGAALGLVTGLALFLPLLVWSGAVAGPGAWIALALLQALFFLPLGAALALVSRLAGWPIWTAALWVGEEALRDRLPFGGFPWGRLAFSQGHTWLTPLAALGGAPLVTFAVAVLGGGLAAIVVRRSLLPGLAAAAVVLVVAPLVGAVLDGPGDKIRNAGIVWDPVTGAGDMYVKQHPVPFGEYMPYRTFFRKITDKVDLIPRDFAAGTTAGVLDVGPARLGDVICFEVAYDGLVRDAVRRGGRLLVVQTNNATFGRSGETVQQLAMGQLRAVEHGRTVLVAATSGVSAVIGADGEMVDRSEVFTRDVLVQRVALRDDLTPATRLGLVPEIALAGLALLGLLLALRTGVRR